MSKEKRNAGKGTIRPFVRCPVCQREWQSPCEQGVAIAKRGKCIVCLVEMHEHFEVDPYEFASVSNATGQAASGSESPAPDGSEVL